MPPPAVLDALGVDGGEGVPRNGEGVAHCEAVAVLVAEFALIESVACGEREAPSKEGVGGVESVGTAREPETEAEALPGKGEEEGALLSLGASLGLMTAVALPGTEAVPVAEKRAVSLTLLLLLTQAELLALSAALPVMVADAPLGEALPGPGEAVGVPPLPSEGEGCGDTLGEELSKPLAVGDAELQGLVVTRGDALPLPTALLLWAGEADGRAGEALPRGVRVPAALVPEAAGLSVLSEDAVARGEGVPPWRGEGEGGMVTVPPRW